MPTHEEARAALLAAVDLAMTTPVAARNKAVKWSERTCREYLDQVGRARTWWENERRAARQLAHEAGLDGIPAPAAAAFMPWTPDRCVRYVQHLAEQGLAVATIRKALTAIKAWHRLHGIPVPDGLPASEALQAHDANLRAAGRPPEHAVPAGVDVILRLLAGCARDPQRLRGTRDAAAIALTVTGMATPAALAEMRRSDVEPTEHGLRLRPDSDGGNWVDVGHWRDGDAHEPALCPVDCVLTWTAYLDSRGVTGELPLLRGVDQHNNVAGLDTFAGRTDGLGQLDDQAFGYIVRRIAAAAEVDPPPTMTELRIGGIILRRTTGTGVAQLAQDSGVVSLLRYVILAESSTTEP